MKDEFQFVPPGWEDIFGAYETDDMAGQVPAASVASDKSEDWMLLVMIEGRPDYSLLFDSQDEAFQGQYELLSAIKDQSERDFSTSDDDSPGFVKITSSRASITVRARSVVGAYVCRARDISQRE